MGLCLNKTNAVCPLYEYECDACHQRFERIQKYSDPPIDVCVKCGKGPVRKLFSSPAIQFKGSGFYITDYAREVLDRLRRRPAATPSSIQRHPPARSADGILGGTPSKPSEKSSDKTEKKS